MKNRRIIYLIGFLFSIPIALTSYINSSFLENFTNPYFVSLIYIVASTLAIIGLLEMPRLLSRLGNWKTSIIFSLIALLSLGLLALSHNPYIVVLAFITYFVSTNFIYMTLDIYIEGTSGQKSVGKFRGYYLTIINSAWIIAQLISGSIIAKSSFSGIYLLSLLFVVLMILVLIIFLRKFKDAEYKKISVKKTVKFFIESKNMSKIYLINLVLKFFFAWMIIYTPIYLHEYMGFGWDKIGIIFTLMLLPFVLLEFPLGKLSDRIGEKKMLKIGFLTASVATLAIPLIGNPDLLLWAAILFITRMGAATIEIMSESYFFKSVSEEHADEISFFRNTTPLSFIIAPLLAIPVLYLTPSFKYIFLVLGAILLLGYMLSYRLRDVK